MDKQARKQYFAEWYKKNKQSVIERISKNQQEKWKWWNEYKSTLKCCQCGISHPAVLCFHHLDKKEKEFTVFKGVQFNLSKERIIDEINKCQVLCSNCHKILHWNEVHK